MAGQPPSRPRPDVLKPPNGALGATANSLTPTVPARIALETRKARLMSDVYTPAPRPYGESLAIRIASSSSANGITDRTGPKISSRAIGHELSTSANSVGLT